MQSIQKKINLLKPADGAEVSLMCSNWREILVERSLREIKADTEADCYDRADYPAAVEFSWDRPVNGVLEIAADENFAQIVKNIAVSGSSAEVYNLEIAREYFWRVAEENEFSPIQRFSTAGDTPRMIKVPGTRPVNIRDAGGKMTLSGQRTRQGMIYRGSELNGYYIAEAESIDFMLDELGIRSDLDLRYTIQTEPHDNSPLEPAARWVKYPVNAYNSFTDEQNELFCDTIRFFADPANYPIYVHCAGGSDRTGEIVFLLDMLLNVSEESAFIDYELSSMSYFPRIRTIDYLQEYLSTIESMSPPGTTRQEQVVNYLMKIGVSKEEIESIRNIMVEK